MRRHIVWSFLALLAVSFLPAPIVAQQPNVQTDVEALRQLGIEWSERYEREHAVAVEWAAQRGISLRQTTPDGREIELVYFRRGWPVYYITDNRDAAISVSTDDLWVGGTSGIDLTGAGVVLYQWDGGVVLLSHQEFGGRVSWADGASDKLSSHSTHVAGTLVALGVSAPAHGMAYGATLRAYDYAGDQSEMTAAAADGALLSNHSYSGARGWNEKFYEPDGVDRWFWWGDTTVSVTEDAEFGFYGELAQEWDEIAIAAPYYLMIKSAGNDRGDNHEGGHYVWNSVSHDWVWSTAPRDDDGGETGYDTIPIRGTAKNILTIGATMDVDGGYGNPDDVDMTTFSGWGPTDDGRIKPDLVGNGFELTSCDTLHNFSYSTKNGTSMSSPNVTGSLGLLVEHYRNENAGADMRAATVKALAIHTADECGPGDGPDYMFGWGLLNTLSAAEHISIRTDPPAMQELVLSDDNWIDQSWYHCDDGPIKATICWTDPPGTPVSPLELDPSDPMLVHDLDLKVFGPTGLIHRAWILYPDHPDYLAGTGDNTRDNVEVVYIENPIQGKYTVQISHKGTLSADQPVSLMLTGVPRLYTVNASGSGDFPTIQAAVDALPACSVIELLDGTYVGPGNRGINFNGKDLYVRSASGDPQSCIIDCQNVDRGFRFKEGETSQSIVEGLTIKNGYSAETGGGISCYFESSPTIRNVIFLDNDAGERGGGLAVGWSSHPMIIACTFHNNGAPLRGAGIYCTYYAGIHIERTIITASRTAESFWCPVDSKPSHITCCNFHDNEGGDWVSNMAEYHGVDDNVSVDPLYCDAPDDLSLCADSPCLFTIDHCSPQIGALGQGCSSCGPQVCCLDGACYVYTDQSECDAIGGDWHPEWEVCDPNPCPQPDLHACCDGEDCTLTTDVDCTGTWYGDLDVCYPNPCWLRACCIGETCTITTQHDCTGIWYITEDSCDPNPCTEPPTAVCCTVSDGCFIITEEQCDVWYSGTWYPNWDSCEPNPCRRRACCINEVCTVTIETDCDGIWHPNLLTCDWNPCDLAVCCTGDGCEITTNDACDDAGGEWYVDWDVCDPNPCRRRACCVGATCTITLESDCDSGTWHEDLSYCDPNPCPAPCCTDAVCTITTESACLAGGGIWHPEWASCAGDPCPAVCCSYGDCYLRTAQECSNLGGAWHPEGTSCDPDPCWIVVKPDGTGDYATIQAAINAVGDYEIIALTNGVFEVETHQGSETQGINFHGKAIWILSMSGNAEACIIDGNSAHRGFIFENGEGNISSIRNVTIRNCVAASGSQPYDGGGGVLTLGASPSLIGCIFLNNHAEWAGGLGCQGAAGSEEPQISDCHFIGNTAQFTGGGMGIVANVRPVMNGCSFVGNSVIDQDFGSGGGLIIGEAEYNAGAEASGLTFYGNSALHGGAIATGHNPFSWFDRVIIAYTQQGGAVSAPSAAGAPQFTCTDIFGNAGGDWVGAIQDQLGQSNNISENPLFCDRPDNLTLCMDSPCLPEHSPCGQLIGAFGMGCVWCQGSSNLSNGVLIAHHPEGLQYEQGQDWCSRYASEFAITTCQEQNNRIEAHGDTAMVWYVLAAWNGSKQWCKTEFGLGNYDDQDLVITDHGSCFPGEGSENPTASWPAPNEGIILEITDTNWSGNFIPVYWFAGYTTGNAAALPLDVHPETGVAATTDCGFPSDRYTAACLGGMGFGMDGTYCCPWTPGETAVCCNAGVCELLTVEECAAQGGAWHPFWDTCNPNPCPAACCLAGDCTVTTTFHCGELGGDWQAAEATCDPNPCIAVCCIGTECVLLTEQDCETASGTWYPELTECDPNPCPAACCIGEACVFTSSGDCAGQGGTWYADEGTCAPNPCIPPRDWADHDIGNCILTMTNQGTLGFLDNSQSEGSGFVFPDDGENILFLGGCWLGVNATYIANRDYDADPNKEWAVASDPDGHVWIDENGTSMQDIHSAYTDSAATAPVGLFVDQESWAYTVNEATADFVIVRYTFKNLGASTLDDLYAGVFMDLDIGDWGDDTGGAVDSLDLIYMTDDSNIHAGVSVLYDMGDPPRRNLTLIDNETFVWPNEYVLDADKWDFLTAADPSHMLTEPDSLGDYGLLASAGPFSLGSGEERLVSFAILGGESLERLLQNAHVAQMVYSGSFTDAPDEPTEPIRMTCLRSCFPNPFRHETTVRYELSERSRVVLSIYDVDGSLVRRLADEFCDPGRHQTPWDGRTKTGRRAPAGVYFLKFVSKDVREGRRLILLR